MNIRYIPLSEYEQLWDICKSKMRYFTASLHPSLKHMTVMGLSGEGTPFANEYERMLHEHLNPPMPLHIDYYEADGLVRYKPEIETPPDFCYGVIERIGLDMFFITKESYSPGAWAGSLKMHLDVKSDSTVMGKILILGLNLDNRSVSFLLLAGKVERGYKLYRSK